MVELLREQGLPLYKYLPGGGLAQLELEKKEAKTYE
jgi:hypothetical protein